MAQRRSKSWKLDRASVHTKAKSRPRSNKYSASDTTERPAPRSRGRVWVGGYRRADGTRVAGHYRAAT